ncbi:bifunctional diaminohydroxyphosphoribosylaminopyrimidine deaminase/5-amino-6-(5-phosphoribosylamino)uracil reductase RibD [Williamsia sp. CHRR-6]|uniref:bifunctional diaminohydroxyphosphoribosylaminopyrimidine deaminase/5-amino-6-(5-phosphoribosylamino)uracil reductase RibD n=1 Tax=Williamsia sp. CHRR-6 TaxID=2835871 RepID=UPI001BD9CD92|nr:bifunctional diaminohydroxyphosphoribosylaminopyrimidine deaminase/5-amino-6-(5-phosphoribosylamino)uracil reductase RibD [Williamsia sp. CHRR-6]MBT0568025.1 bifunctional diaminohydroxyphosphoribosylaminopyrimidine deaminase/5-amino-6-(5-phosphoribosylamino)uracil reductase RibD [Williamsia sp. CHRR-6]
MRTAIEASIGARGVSSPNPPVGAVILAADGSVAGVGHTQPVGGPHAEVIALRAAAERARGGTAVVTLEPCDHTGRTGPCTAALRAAGIVRVAYAVTDPDPVAGGGSDSLRAAGIEVIGGVLADEVAAGPLCEWLFRRAHGRPHVTVKIAATLDGRIAAPDGSSRWITGAQAREHAHRDRSQLDAIVVGTGTVITDDPALTARRPDGSLYPRQPIRVAMGLRAVPAHARIRSDEAPTLIVPSHDPHAVLAALDDALSVLIEGGPRVIGAFVAADLVDRVQVYLAPLILGAGAAAVEDGAVRTLTDGHRFERIGVQTLGDDVLLTLKSTR